MEFYSFLDYLHLEKKYSHKTIVAYKNDLNSFYDFNLDNFEQKGIKKVNYSQIRSWIVLLVNKGISNKTINRKISSLNSLYKFLKKVGINKNNPLDQHKSLKTKSIVQIPFSKLEVSNVLDSDNFKSDFEGIRDNLILEILYCTGVRRQELINLKINNIDLANQRIKVLGKRNKERFIPILNSTVRLLNNYLEKDDLQREVMIEKLPTEKIEQIISLRQSAKEQKNFELSDKLRDDLLKREIILEDGPDGTTWKFQRIKTKK